MSHLWNDRGDSEAGQHREVPQYARKSDRQPLVKSNLFSLWWWNRLTQPHPFLLLDKKQETFLKLQCAVRSKEEKGGRKLSLLASTVASRVSAMSENLKTEQLHRDLGRCRWFSIQCDESGDTNSTAQLMMFVLKGVWRFCHKRGTPGTSVTKDNKRYWYLQHCFVKRFVGTLKVWKRTI